MQKPSIVIRSYDLLIALLIGIGFAIVSAWVISPHLISSATTLPYISPNFGDYCEYLGLWDVQNADAAKDIDFNHPGRRTMAASIPAKLFLSSFGIIDGLAAGAFLCSIIFAASLYLWATALFGRFAGFCTILAALSTANLCLITRHFTFYPTIIASFTLSAAITTIAMRNNNRGGIAYLFAGLSIGFSLLVDVRGLIWVGICIPLLVLSAMLQKGGLRKLRNLLFLGIPIWASFQLGTWNTGRLNPSSLEEQVDIRPLAHAHGARGSDFSPPYFYPDGYTWGVSSLRSLPKTVQFMVGQIQIKLPESVLSVRRTETEIYIKQVQIWEKISIIALIISIIALRKDRWALTGLIVTGIPYAAAQLGIHTQHEFRVRFLFHTLPYTAILIGIACMYVLFQCNRVLVGMGLLNPVNQDRFPQKTLRWIFLLGSTIITLNICGVIDGPLSPKAEWRGKKWMISHGHINNVSSIIDNNNKNKYLSADSFKDKEGLDKKWFFRQEVCIPLLFQHLENKDYIFETTFYDEVEFIGSIPVQRIVPNAPLSEPMNNPSQDSSTFIGPSMTQPTPDAPQK